MVKVVEMDTDRYSRLVGLIEHNGQSVNLGLAAQGHAWYYGQYCKAEPICGQIKSAEAEARAGKRGLWANGNPVPPWQWRNKK
jgi:endonuclease YncB( thermonuclease family)